MRKPHAAPRQRSSLASVDRALSIAATPRPLRREELPAETVALARYLIGRILVHDSAEGRTSGRIVETEAYVVGDASGHAFRGETRRNRSLFLDRGHAYVYFIYGCWFSLNVSSEQAGIGAGVLLRAVEPLEGTGLMARRRGTNRPRDLARGPGRLAAAFGIDARLDGIDLCAGNPLWLGEAGRPEAEIGASIRIGITKEAHRVLRFYERGSLFVSGPASLSP